DTRIPFMAMPDAIKSLLMLAKAPREHLTRSVYNVTSFSLSAQEAAQIIEKAFPAAKIGFNSDDKRQVIVDSWAADMDDSAAHRDWDWQPDYDLDGAFQEYLIPALRKHYA
ncbi:MAG TPA: hypothetical protein VJZ27_16505, partial [Aggregatilineales bacterium]|nr:hypothetical protein [Aggregatilineales bacterium]